VEAEAPSSSIRLRRGSGSSMHRGFEPTHKSDSQEARIGLSPEAIRPIRQWTLIGIEMSQSHTKREVPPIGRNLELLCRVKLENPIASAPHGSFGNIIELGSESLLLEATREYAVADEIIVEVVFPGQKRKGDPVSLLHCVVRKVYDEPELHYAADLVEASEVARDRLDAYLNRAAEREKDLGGMK
jgi:hypothetical protein